MGLAITAFVSAEQPANTPAPRLVTVAGMVTLLKLVQPSKAASTMVVTELGIVIWVRELQCANAPYQKTCRLPMVVTGIPLTLEGITTAVSVGGHSNATISRVPLLVT